MITCVLHQMIGRRVAVNGGGGFTNFSTELTLRKAIILYRTLYKAVWDTQVPKQLAEETGTPSPIY